MDETLIVTYSPKYKAYQKKVRARQIERAEKIIQSSGAKRKAVRWFLCGYHQPGRGCW